MYSFFGDLNYRIDMEYGEIRRNINGKNWDALQQYDQLFKSMNSGLSFKNFREGPLNFAPTYRYDVGTDVYDTSEKRRAPAWCDRILFKAENIVQYNYKAGGLMSSDHKPVSSVFGVKVKTINPEKLKKIETEILKSQGSTEEEIKSTLSSTDNGMLIDLDDINTSNSSEFSNTNPFAEEFIVNPSDPLPRSKKEEKKPEFKTNSVDLFDFDSSSKKAPPPLPPKKLHEEPKKLPPAPFDPFSNFFDEVPPKKLPDLPQTPVDPFAKLVKVNSPNPFLTNNNAPPTLPPKSTPKPVSNNPFDFFD